MTRKEYMEQLRKYLKRLPKEDYENAIEYFSEYFDEAGPENEQETGKTVPEKKRRNCRQKVPATDGVQQDKMQLLQPVILQRRNVLRVRSSSLQFLSSVRHR